DMMKQKSFFIDNLFIKIFFKKTLIEILGKSKEYIEELM
ncbi:unnamed protein product, partial [marine sediment metagenome]